MKITVIRFLIEEKERKKWQTPFESDKLMIKWAKLFYVIIF